MEEYRRGRLLQRREVYGGKIVDLIVDRIELDGEPHIREVVRHPGGVVVLGETEDRRIPFVRQLRYPMNQVLLELPAGKIDPGEDPAVTAAREMEEETGFRPREMQHVLSFYSSPGFCDELLHLFYSNRLLETTPNHEEDEEITIEFHSLDQALRQAFEGEIIDAKTLVALFWLKDRRSRE